MKKLVLYSFLAVFSMILIQACGPSQKERQAQKTARQNQIAQARQDSIAKAQAEAAAKRREAEMENQKQDTTAKDTMQSMPKKKKMQAPEATPTPSIQYSSKGDYTVQVGSWRSKVVADNHLSKWKKRGYTHAYIIKFGNEDTGNIWYRIRLGVVESKEMATQLKQEIQDKYQQKSWVSYVGSEKSTSSK
jgi:cell division septation protein DedD